MRGKRLSPAPMIVAQGTEAGGRSQTVPLLAIFIGRRECGPNTPDFALVALAYGCGFAEAVMFGFCEQSV